MFEQTLADSERLLNSDDFDIVLVRSDLAVAYLGAGRHDEAISLLERALADSERILGPEHRGTLTACRYLAIAYREAGRQDEDGSSGDGSSPTPNGPSGPPKP